MSKILASSCAHDDFAYLGDSIPAALAQFVDDIEAWSVLPQREEKPGPFAGHGYWPARARPKVSSSVYEIDTNGEADKMRQHPLRHETGS